MNSTHEQHQQTDGGQHPHRAGQNQSHGHHALAHSVPVLGLSRGDTLSGVSIGPGRRPFTAAEIEAVVWMYNDGRPLNEVAGGIGRCQGSLGQLLPKLRAQGLIGRRHA